MDIARAWKEAKPLRHEIDRIEQAVVREPAWHVDVLHVAGRLRATDAGVRLEAADSLLRSTDLAARFPALELCVLQGPAIARSRLTSRERDQAALLRSFAFELAEHGIPAVMTLPPLQHERAREALAAIAGPVGPRRRRQPTPPAGLAGGAGGDRAWAHA